MRLIVFVSLLAFATLMSAGTAQAACTTPAGNAGQVIYNSTYNVIQYCNGSNWINTGAKNASAANTGCSNPTGKRGDVVFNGTAKVHQFCNGEAWMNMACSQIAASSGSGCTNPTGPRGALAYVTPANKLQMCDGVKWLNAGAGCVADCPNAGDLCKDGTIYAGISPDGNNRMYTTRCDAGMTWNGSNCTGSGGTYEWGALGSDTGQNSAITGKANSAYIAANWGNTKAARYCENLVENGNSDWYLPALNEANVLFKVAALTSSFKGSNWWVSTEQGPDTAYVAYPNGSSYDLKEYYKSVRCVRR